MMQDLSPKKTYIDCSGVGYIIAHEISNNSKHIAESEEKNQGQSQ